MAIRKLLFDSWEANVDKGGEVDIPSWKDIETAIRALNGAERTLVTLQTAGVAHMAIGGGKAERYIVYATFDNIAFQTLVGRPDRSGAEMLLVGGQAGNYPARFVTNVDTAIKVARTFSTLAQLDSNQVWEAS
jgi:hypothetical protein